MMLWRSISGVVAVILPDSWKAALRWSCLAGIFGHKLAHCGRCIAFVWAEKVVLCGAKLGEQPRSFNCGAAQAFSLVPKQSPCCYENVLWKTFHLELKSHLYLHRTCSWTEFYFLSKLDFLVLDGVEITAPPSCSSPALRGLGASGAFWQRRWFVQQERCRG